MSGYENMDIPAGARVVVAMSGGVDSSVTAALMAEAGYDVVGITLQLYDYGEATRRPGACCAGEDIHDARRVAERIGIPHYVLDYEDRFRAEVMEDFADSYIRGETPIPCVKCNQTVKFRDLVGAARDLGAAALATGHYVRSVGNGAAGRRLLTAVDGAKDQSYFLFATTADQMELLRFPLGGMEKGDVRRAAERFGLAVAAKPDSQDICFVPGGRYVDVIERLRPGAAEPGDIVHLDGRVLGRHEGIVHYTIGQRRGLRVGGEAEPLFVVRLEPAAKRVIVGPREALLTAAIEIDEVNWLGPSTGEGEEIDISVRVRSTRPPVPARISLETGHRARITFAEPEEGVSPGQAAVIYSGEEVWGGGWIRETVRAAADGQVFAAGTGA